MRKLKKIVLNILFIVICVAVAYVISNYLFTSIPVDGVSMEKTLHHEDTLLLYKVGNYKLGDIVVFNSHRKDKDGNDLYLVKRIMGMPGDTVEIIYEPTDGNYYLYVNSEKMIEDYVSEENKMFAPMERITVAEGEFFYLGDNRRESSDSRSGYRGKLDSIVGRVLMRYRTKDKLDFEIIRRFDIFPTQSFLFPTILQNDFVL